MVHVRAAQKTHRSVQISALSPKLDFLNGIWKEREKVIDDRSSRLFSIVPIGICF
jgi:hypothetical protein